MPNPTFPLGLVVATPGLLDQIPEVECLAALQRHAACDWGDVCAFDGRANDRALKTGARILSAYHSSDGTKFWIITEADRSSTCLLLPEEY